MTRHRLPFRIPFFRIFYSTTYTSLYAIVLVLLAITPASLIYTSISAKAFQYIFMIGGVYVLTAILAILIYSSRLYTNRIVLAGVGKSWIPIEEGELGRNVRKMVKGALQRSAIVAWETRPRDLAADLVGVRHGEDEHARDRDALMRRGSAGEDGLVGELVPVNPYAPPWGLVQHPGWSSPSELATETSPHIYFMTVIHELPNLIEAQAVALVALREDEDGLSVARPPLAVEQITTEMLQRPLHAGMRDYLAQLSSLDLISPPETGEHFLALYEHARFSARALSEPEFQALMHAFAALLSGIALPRPTPPSPARAPSPRIASPTPAQAHSQARPSGHANPRTAANGTNDFLSPLTAATAAATRKSRTPSPASSTSSGPSQRSLRHPTQFLAPRLPSVFAAPPRRNRAPESPLAGRGSRSRTPSRLGGNELGLGLSQTSAQARARRSSESLGTGSVVRMGAVSSAGSESGSGSGGSLRRRSSESGRSGRSGASGRSAESVIRLAPVGQRGSGQLPYSWAGSGNGGIDAAQ